MRHLTHFFVSPKLLLPQNAHHSRTVYRINQWALMLIAWSSLIGSTCRQPRPHNHPFLARNVGWWGEPPLLHTCARMVHHASRAPLQPLGVQPEPPRRGRAGMHKHAAAECAHAHPARRAHHRKHSQTRKCHHRGNHVPG